MTGHLARIEKVEQTVAELKTTAALSKDHEASRAEYRKLAEAAHLEVSSPRALPRPHPADSRSPRFTSERPLTWRWDCAAAGFEGTCVGCGAGLA